MNLTPTDLLELYGIVVAHLISVTVLCYLAVELGVAIGALITASLTRILEFIELHNLGRSK